MNSPSSVVFPGRECQSFLNSEGISVVVCARTHVLTNMHGHACRNLRNFRFQAHVLKCVCCLVTVSLNPKKIVSDGDLKNF
jgi:hypothetical protein